MPRTHADRAHVLAERLIAFLETGTPPEGLFAPDVFLDITYPRWREQASGIEGAVAVRKAGHPTPGRVPRWRFDPTPTGFVVEVEETWQADGEQWYCRELMRADIDADGVTDLSVYCTGDWDGARREEHARSVALLRP